jgi:hypothetical protein
MANTALTALRLPSRDRCVRLDTAVAPLSSLLPAPFPQPMTVPSPDQVVTVIEQVQNSIEVVT